MEDWHVDPAGEEAEAGQGEDHGQDLRALSVDLGRDTDQSDGCEKVRSGPTLSTYQYFVANSNSSKSHSSPLSQIWFW